ncbi:MAG: DUF2235 domain-containing protein [Pseudomonadota bacterium]
MTRPSRLHVFIIDGTLSRLTEGQETNAGLTFRLLQEVGPKVDQTFGYNPGVQGAGLRGLIGVAAGYGLNASIQDGYATLCSRYTDGDRIMLFGYSRGAYAVRSLAGFITRIGLLRRRHATARRVARAFRYYQAHQISDQGRRFSQAYCRQNVAIEAVCVWDTVKALGLPLPLISRLAPMATHFHDADLGPQVAHGFHALALDETRLSYAPLLWTPGPDQTAQVQQMWFPGGHGDVGGHVWRAPSARPLANLSLVWVLERAQACGLQLPPNWRARLPTDPAAARQNLWAGHNRFFWRRAARTAGEHPTEALHDSVAARMRERPHYRPKATWQGAALPGPSDASPALPTERTSVRTSGPGRPGQRQTPR